MPQWLVIGISGVTCGGKTTLAHNLQEYFLGHANATLWNTPYTIGEVRLISQDDYFLPVEDVRHKWIKRLNAINFELLTALDMQQMLADIAWTIQGGSIHSKATTKVESASAQQRQSSSATGHSDIPSAGASEQSTQGAAVLTELGHNQKHSTAHCQNNVSAQYQRKSGSLGASSQYYRNYAHEPHNNYRHQQVSVCPPHYQHLAVGQGQEIQPQSLPAYQQQSRQQQYAAYYNQHQTQYQQQQFHHQQKPKYYKPRSSQQFQASDKVMQTQQQQQHQQQQHRLDYILQMQQDFVVNILIIEGFIIFNQPELLAFCNIKFHFHLPYEKCFERRQRRTYDPPDVTGYFEICVWPHYERSFAEFRSRKDIILLNGDLSMERVQAYAVKQIKKYIKGRCDMASQQQTATAQKLVGGQQAPMGRAPQRQEQQKERTAAAMPCGSDLSTDRDKVGDSSGSGNGPGEASPMAPRHSDTDNDEEDDDEEGANISSKTNASSNIKCNAVSEGNKGKSFRVKNKRRVGGSGNHAHNSHQHNSGNVNNAKCNNLNYGLDHFGITNQHSKKKLICPNDQHFNFN